MILYSRILFIVFAAAFSCWITWLFGESLAATHESVSFLSGGKMLLLCGTGWLLTMAAAALFAKPDTLSYLAHLAALQIIGVLILVPAILFSEYFGIAGLVFSAASVLCSSAIMLRGHIRRIRLLGLSQAWTFCWFVFLQAGAISSFLILKK